MPEKASTKTPRRRRRRTPSIAYKKELAPDTTGANLWSADHALFHEFAGRRKIKPAELLREIVHNWAVTIRVSGQAKDSIEMAGPVRKLHQQIISEELAPVREALAEIANQLSTPSTAQPSANGDTLIPVVEHRDSILLSSLQNLAEELKATKEELRILRGFAIAHYMLSSQSFAATWATLDFLQRYIVEPTLKKDPAHQKDSFQASITHRDDARLEGLQMVEQMCLEFQYPGEYSMVLIRPEESQV
jgi:hypothetical protein